MELLQVYSEGNILSQEVLSLKPEDLLMKFSQGIQNVLALSIGAGIPVESTVPIMIRNGFKNLAAIAMNLDYDMKQLKEMKQAAAQQTAAPAAAAPKKDAPKEEPKQEEEKAEEEDVDMGDLFGDF